uniref:RNA helicase n=1 Tax=Meloidogyne incognita TaxID=6306 RepID=A0A914MF86_MELIC
MQMEFNATPEIEQYIEKFQHFVHLFFANEKIDLEDKFMENATVVYIEHRRPPAINSKGVKQKHTSSYGVYKFKLSESTMDELVSYAKVVIDGHLGAITFINKDDKTIDVTFEDNKGQILFDQSQKYTIDIEFNDRQYRSFLRSLELLKSGRATFTIFPDAGNLISYEDYQKEFNHYFEKKVSKKVCSQVENKFDKMQNQAIYSIVRGVHGTVPFVLWGPPGTGKTVTIIECIKQLLEKNPANRILICTPSNMAADLIARRIYQMGILPATQMRRYYSLGKNVNDRDKDLDKIIKIENCALYGITDDRFGLDSYKEIIQLNIRLIFSTLACSAYLEENINEPDFFSHIFIDEASQSFEPETLIPITRFATENTRVILCGDYQQLGAICKPYFLKVHKQTCCSLMERLLTTAIKQRVYTDGRTFCKLNESYRCHPSIIEFSSNNFYSGELMAVRGQERTGFCQWRYLPRKNFPIILHVVSKGAEVRQADGGRSFHNMEEVDVVIKYIDLIKKTMSDIKDSDIGVISPYKQQTSKIRELLCRRKDITVDSVECFQGSERRVIIISLSRSEQLGFLSEYKRINTSFTRAKELLVVIVSQAFINVLDPHNKKNYWKKFIHFCIENDAVTIDKFAGEDGREIDPEEMDNFKKTIMDSINSDLTTRGERPGPRLKQSVPSQSNLEDDLNDLTTTNKSSPPRKLHGVHPTPLFKTRNDATENKPKESNKSLNKSKENKNNDESKEWLSDDDEAGTEFWAKHFASCKPSNLRPYLSNGFNDDIISEDEDEPKMPNSVRSESNNRSNINKPKSVQKMEEKHQAVLMQEAQKSNKQEKTASEGQKVNKRLVPVLNTSSRPMRSPTTVAEQIKFRGNIQKMSKSPEPFTVGCMDLPPSGHPDLCAGVGVDLASMYLDEQRVRDIGSNISSEQTPKKKSCSIM